MDFDDIKKTWKNSFKDNELLDKQDIEARLNIKGKSNTALNKVKRNYKIEVYSSVLLTIFVLFWLYTNIDTNQKYLVMALSLVFFGILIAFAIYNYLKVKNTVISTDQLKPALKQTINDIERYVKFNKSNFTKYILFPFTILFGMFLGLSLAAEKERVIDLLYSLENLTIIKLSIAFVVFSVAVVPISQYINKKMYKQHLDELKKCLEEFEQIEEEN